MAVKIFSSRIFLEECARVGIDPKYIRSEFEKLKSRRAYPKIFGKDARYDRPDTVVKADLWHIHFSEDGTWDIKIAYQAPGKRTSDAAIVYCTDVAPFQDHYCLIALLHTNAHKRMNKVTFACDLVDVAEDFRRKRDLIRRASI